MNHTTPLLRQHLRDITFYEAYLASVPPELFDHYIHVGIREKLIPYLTSSTGIT
jgi:hypothetical protein